MSDQDVRYRMYLDGVGQFEHGMASMKEHANLLDSSMSHLKSIVFELAGAYAGFEVIKESLEIFKQHQEEVQKLTVMYENNKDSVHETLPQLEALALAQEKITGIYQENFMAAESNLMKYRDLKISITDILPVAANFAKLTGTDVADAANLMGRALAHPEMAARLLRNSGIQLNAAQTKVLAHLTATGKGAEVQAKIFELLKGKFEGVAEAMFESHPLEKINLQFREMKISIGELLEKGLMIITPYIIKVMSAVESMVTWMEEHTEALKIFGMAIVGIGVAMAATAIHAWFAATAFGAVALRMGLATAAEYALTTVQIALNAAMDANPIGLIVLAIAALVIAIYEAYQHFEMFRRVVNTAWAAIKAYGMAVWDWGVAPLKSLYHAAVAVWDVLTGDVTGAKENIRSVVDDWTAALDDIKGGVTKVQEAWNADYSDKSGATSPKKKLDASKGGIGKGEGSMALGDQSSKVSGTKQVVINVSINKLVELIKIEAKNIKEGAAMSGEHVAKALLAAVDQFSASADI